MERKGQVFSNKVERIAFFVPSAIGLLIAVLFYLSNLTVFLVTIVSGLLLGYMIAIEIFAVREIRHNQRALQRFPVTRRCK